jgi:DNA-binding CsgD family transcriptional regulator
MPFEEARTRMWMGQVLRRAGHRNEAQRALEAAASVFAELGTPLYADRARAELGRLGGRVAGPFTLTATEKRVADLVGAGRTNQEVAETLFVSVRTVESHLGRIYRKLGLRSRTELARCSSPWTACLADIADWVSSLIGVRLPARGAEKWLVLHGQGGIPRLAFGPVAEMKRAAWPVGAFRQQMHLDPTVSSVAELDAAQNRVVEFGARLLLELYQHEVAETLFVTALFPASGAPKS